MNDIHIHYSTAHKTLRLSFTKDKLKHESTYTPEPAKWRQWLCSHHDMNAYTEVHTMSAYFGIIAELSELMHIQLQRSMVARDKLSIGCSTDPLDTNKSAFCISFADYLLHEEWDEIVCCEDED